MLRLSSQLLNLLLNLLPPLMLPPQSPQLRLLTGLSSNSNHQPLLCLRT